MKVTLDDEIKEVSREINLRRSVYPIMIERGKLSRTDANKHLNLMEAVLDRLQKIKGSNKDQMDLFNGK